MKGMQSQSATNLVSAPTVLNTNGLSSLRGSRGSRGKGGKGKGKGNRDDDRDGGDESNLGVFETQYSTSSTCDDRHVTHGFTLGQCENYVDKGDNGYAHTRSLRYLPGDSDNDPPKWETFFGHGCEGTPQLTGNLLREHAGFESNYVIGTCGQVGGGGYARAYYAAERHQPTYDSVTEGFGVSESNCQADILFEYDIIRVTGDCMEEEGEFYKFDLNNCANGIVTFTSYPDNTCTGGGESEEAKVGECPFDLDFFVEDIEEDEYSGYFNYASTSCYVASPP